MFERDQSFAWQCNFIPVQMSHQVTLAVAKHAVARDEVMHPTANVNRVNLQKPEMVDDWPDSRRRGTEEERAPHETACRLGIDIKRLERANAVQPTSKPIIAGRRRL